MVCELGWEGEVLVREPVVLNLHIEVMHVTFRIGVGYRFRATAQRRCMCIPWSSTRILENETEFIDQP
jgi:hypothetical protein